MTGSLAVGLTTVFSVLGCVITATVVYTLVTDGLPFRKELLTPWMATTLIDFYINIVPIGAWIVYKQSNWIQAVVWIVLLICFGSITTCIYVVSQFLKLSPEDSRQDPIYFVLLRNKKKDGAESKSILSVVTARILFIILGCVMVAALIYGFAFGGPPFRKDVFTPWLTATLVDFYINVFTLSVWVAYKESNLISSAVWIISLICIGSAVTCTYIVLQLFRRSPKDPVYLILFQDSNRAVNGYDAALQTEEHAY